MENFKETNERIQRGLVQHVIDVVGIHSKCLCQAYLIAGEDAKTAIVKANEDTDSMLIEIGRSLLLAAEVGL